jgi:hypothetical protein
MGFLGAAMTKVPPCHEQRDRQPASVCRHDFKRKHPPDRQPSTLIVQVPTCGSRVATDPWPSGPPAPRLHESQGSGRRRPRGPVPGVHEEPTGVRRESFAYVLLLLRRPVEAKRSRPRWHHRAGSTTVRPAVHGAAARTAIAMGARAGAPTLTASSLTSRTNGSFGHGHRTRFSPQDAVSHSTPGRRKRCSGPGPFTDSPYTPPVARDGGSVRTRTFVRSAPPHPPGGLQRRGG